MKNEPPLQISGYGPVDRDIRNVLLYFKHKMIFTLDTNYPRSMHPTSVASFEGFKTTLRLDNSKQTNDN